MSLAPDTPSADPAQMPLLDLDLLRTLVAINDTGTFSAAADAVHRTPSAVSMQVKRLEDLIGRAVFLRNSRSVALTADGERLLEHARHVLMLNRDMVSQFLQPDLTGEVRLGAPDDAAERQLPEVLRRFRDSHPGVVVNVVVAASDRLRDLVATRKLDLALVNAGLSEIIPEGIEVLFYEQLVWAGCRGGAAPAQRPVPLSVWEETCCWRKAAITALNRADLPYRIALTSGHFSGQRAAILADLAVAPFPASSLDDHIVAVPDLPPLPRYALGMCVSDNPATPVLAAADHIRATLGTGRVLSA